MTRLRRKIKQAVCALCACAGFAASAATIAYVADGTTGPFCGAGYGISVTVSTPATGATVKYAESADGPWRDAVAYTNACTDRPVYFQITAAGYDTVTDARNVTVTPKDIEGLVWPVLPAEDYVYDGTAKTPDAGFGDGEPSILTANDFDVAYADNVDAGTATMTFTGRNNYAGTDVQTFEIRKAENAWTTPPAVADWTYGQAAAEPVSAAKSGVAAVTWSSGAKPRLPGSYTATFTVPESRNYKALTATAPFTIHAATIRYAADGTTGEYCGAGYGVSVTVSTPATGATVEYAEAETGPWSATPIAYTNACTARPVWFRITAAGYDTVVDSRNVTVTPKSLEGAGFVWPVLPAEGYVYDGTAKEPDIAFGDGEPSLLAREDFDITYEDNVEAGTAKMVVAGRRNYAGRDEQEFDIAPRDIALVTVAPIADQDFAGAAVEPVPAVTDGEPSIVTADDYTVSYADNAAPGTATLTLTGRGNYAGTKVVTFVILSAARDVVFDALGGRIGSAVAVTQSMTRVYGDLPTATRAGYVLDGWFLGVTNGAPQAVRGAELLADADHALYARWSPDPAVAYDPETLYAWEATGAATARILGLRDPNVRLAQLILPDRIGGLFVTEIAAGAFANTACGATALALPVFCTAVGDKAFYNAATLASVTFADARRWDNPAAAAEVAVGRYAFSSCLGLSEVMLAESVSSLGDYAFLNCRNLRKIVVLGRPDVGEQAFRSAGLDGAGGVEVLIDQALADDADYMARLKAGVPSVTVRTDAIVTAIRTAALAVSGRTVRLAVAVERAAAWGAVDASALRVEYRAQLGDAPAVLMPRAVVREADGSLTLEVEAPEGDSGFFRVRMGE